MKISIQILFYLLFLPLLFCGEAAEEAAEYCDDPPTLIVKNSSEYIILELYMHDTADYSVSPVTIATGMGSDSELPVNVSSGDIKYFTFIRNVTSTSSVEIAVTTAYPVTFEGCTSYMLHILEEDFFLSPP